MRLPAPGSNRAKYRGTKPKTGRLRHGSMVDGPPGQARREGQSHPRQRDTPGHIHTRVMSRRAPPGSDLPVNAAHLGLRPRDSNVCGTRLKIHLLFFLQFI